MKYEVSSPVSRGGAVLRTLYFRGGSVQWSRFIDGGRRLTVEWGRHGSLEVDFHRDAE